jgi:regulator of RNase E activity RraA
VLNEFAELIDKNIILRAKLLSVPQLCDGMKELGIPQCGCMSAEINAVHPDMKVVGTAATIDTSNGDNFPIHVATYAVPQEGYVMVVAGKGYMERAYLGDLIMGAAEAAGYTGIVVDGCTRDQKGNIKLGFPVFSKGFMPAGPIKKNPGNINTAVVCAGVEVAPGDLVAGDCDGVCVVPREHILEVLHKAEEKKAYEEKREKAIAAYGKAKAAGEELPQLAPQWVLDMLK